MDTITTTKTIADVEVELNNWARARGFNSHWDMANKLETGKVKLSNDQIRKGLDDLKPIADDAAMAAAKAAVDVTGLPAIENMQKSVARMIRVLLLGYDQDEVEFLQDRGFGIQFLDNARQNTVKARARIMERLEQHAANHHEPVAVRRAMRP